MVATRLLRLKHSPHCLLTQPVVLRQLRDSFGAIHYVPCERWSVSRSVVSDCLPAFVPVSRASFSWLRTEWLFGVARAIGRTQQIIIRADYRDNGVDATLGNICSANKVLPRWNRIGEVSHVGQVGLDLPIVQLIESTSQTRIDLFVLFSLSNNT